MTSALSRGAFDDDALRKLAQEPARPLFPLLSRAEAMFPLVVVLAFLPALYAVDNRTLTEAGAWEGLSGLNCLGAQTLGAFVDPAAGDPEHPFPYQPPLMSWLTATGMKLLGTERPAGFLVPAYLCTAFLVVAGYVLGRRIGGEQFGLAAAVLMALNPQLLAGAQEPVPQSLACLFAVLSLAGVVAHWQKSSGVISYQLLLGGIALGLCLLAGGPLALAVLLVVFAYVVCWKLDVRLRKPAGQVRESSQFNRRTAYRATAVLAVTAFALGGWNVLFMGSRYELDFWEGWLNGGMTTPVDPVLQERPAGFLGHFRELALLVRPLFGIALLGIVSIVRDWWRAEEDPARHHRGLLLVWIAIALLIYFLIHGRLDPGSPAFKMWELLLIVPLIMSAALGLIAIAERRIGFVPAMAFCAVALADAVLMAGDGFSRREPESALVSVGGARFRLLDAISLTALAAGVLCAVRYGRKSDRRKRVVLTGMLAAIAVGTVVWGAIHVRRTADGDHELDELHSGMARLPRTNQCTFVALAAPGTSLELRPPPQVVFVIGSVWPAARINYARSWEDAAEQAPAEMASSDTHPMFLAWSLRGSLRNAVPAANLRSVSPPFHYLGLEFAAYVRGPPPSVATDN